jgi:hypothetical protein
MKPAAPRKTITEKKLKLRSQLWPDLDTKDLWSRKERNGFTTIPRAMPLFLTLVDRMSKAKPLSSTYLELWCRAHDECIVVLNNKEENAFHSGFSGERAVTTWKSRVRALADLGFIRVKPGPSGDLSYALILNPYIVVKQHYQAKHPAVTDAAYNALMQRATEIGANDLD